MSRTLHECLNAFISQRLAVVERKLEGNKEAALEDKTLEEHIAQLKNSLSPEQCESLDSITGLGTSIGVRLEIIAYIQGFYDCLKGLTALQDTF